MKRLRLIMADMKHRTKRVTRKVRIARRLRSRKEIKENTSLFGTIGWNIRKNSIAKRVENSIKR